MKKYALMAVMALSLGFVACDDPEDAPGKPQSYPQESIMATNDLAVAPVQATATAVDFAKFSGEGTDNLIPVLQVTKMENWPADYELVGVMQYAADESFADARNITLQFNPETKVLSAPVDAWETAHIELFTKNPKTVDTYVQFYLYAVNGTTKVNLGPTANTVWNRHALQVTPLPAAVVIEESYTMIANGVAYNMIPTNPANVYDPPTFSAVVNVGEGETVNVTIKSASGKVYGQGDVPFAIKEGGEAIKVTEAGPQKVTVNMEELTYSTSLAIEILYAYTSSAKQGMALTTTDFVNYSGFVGLTGSFMLTNDNTTLSPKLKWGAGTDGDEVIPGTIAVGGPKIPIEEKGSYFLKVNLAALTYEAQYCEFFEIIGSFNGWGDDTARLTPDAKFLKWTGELTITEGDVFKIRTNGNWDGANLGGSMSDLREHGADMVWNLPTGTYTVTLDFSTVPYTLNAVLK